MVKVKKVMIIRKTNIHVTSTIVSTYVLYEFAWERY